MSEATLGYGYGAPGTARPAPSPSPSQSAVAGAALGVLSALADALGMLHGLVLGHVLVFFDTFLTMALLGAVGLGLSLSALVAIRGGRRSGMAFAITGIAASIPVMGVCVVLTANFLVWF